MLVDSKRMQGVPVRTVSGQGVGKLESFEFEVETGRLSGVRVKISGIVPALLDQEALVAWSQIVSMSEAEVVVRDGVAMERAGWLAKKLATTNT
jgi:sporulation protein YlmC with PRC-barrel domain